MKLFKVIDEKEGRELLKREPEIFEEEIMLLTILVEDKIDIDYIKNMKTFLEYDYIGVLISVFNENKEKRDKILEESLEILKKETKLIIIIPNNEKEILKVKENLKNAGEKISNFINEEEILDFDKEEELVKLIPTLLNKVMVYYSEKIEKIKEKNQIIENLCSNLPLKYKNKVKELFLKIEIPSDLKLEFFNSVIENIEEKTEIRTTENLFEIAQNEIEKKIELNGLFEIDEVVNNGDISSLFELIMKKTAKLFKNIDNSKEWMIKNLGNRQKNGTR